MSYVTGGTFGKTLKSGSVNVIVHVKKPVTGEVYCWKCGQVSHLKSSYQKTVDTSIRNTLKARLTTRVSMTRCRESSTIKS